jgi:hypothetical protein
VGHDSFANQRRIAARGIEIITHQGSPPPDHGYTHRGTATINVNSAYTAKINLLKVLNRDLERGRGVQRSSKVESMQSLVLLENQSIKSKSWTKTLRLMHHIDWNIFYKK